VTRSEFREINKRGTSEIVQEDLTVLLYCNRLGHCFVYLLQPEIRVQSWRQNILEYRER
jgi:hypothetical protein